MTRRWLVLGCLFACSSGCARLVTDAELRDAAALGPIARDTTDTSTDKLKDEKLALKKLAIVGFGSSKTTAEKSSFEVFGVMRTMQGVQNTQAILSGSACKSLDAVYARADKLLAERGFVLVDVGDRLTRPENRVIADRGVLECRIDRAPADFGIGTLFGGDVDEKLRVMNRLIAELGVDGLIMVKLAAAGSEAGKSWLTVVGPGPDKAEVVWRSFVNGGRVKFEPPPQGADPVERVFSHTFTLLLARLAEDMK